MAILEIPVPE